MRRLAASPLSTSREHDRPARHPAGDLRALVAALAIGCLTDAAPAQPLLEIKPGSCPASFNPKSKGKLPVVLVGTSDFDVSDVDLLSLTLERADGVGGFVPPLDGPPGPKSLWIGLQRTKDFAEAWQVFGPPPET